MIQPAVSIIVATRNSERFLAEALDSIAAQSFDDYQVLVVDAASTDATLEIAHAYPKVTCIQQGGTGYANAWNNGIATSRSPFVAFLDSDDAWSTDKLASQMAVIEADRHTEVVFGRVQFFLEPGCPLPPGFRPALLGQSHAALMPGTTFIRREALDRVGLLDESMQLASDIPWNARMRDTCVIDSVDRVVLRKRLHAGNLGHTTSWPTFRAELLSVMKQRVDAARATGRADVNAK